MANGEVTIGEVFRKCENLGVEIANLWRRIDSLEAGRKDDRHELRDALMEQIAGIHITLMAHAKTLGTFEERMSSVSIVDLAQRVGVLSAQVADARAAGGKGISIVVTAIVGLVMMILGAWLSTKLAR